MAWKDAIICKPCRNNDEIELVKCKYCGEWMCKHYASRNKDNDGWQCGDGEDGEGCLEE